MILKSTYDKEADAVYVYLADKPYCYTKSLDNMRYIDYALDDTPIGVELLGVSNGVNTDDLPNSREIMQLLKSEKIKTYA